MAVIKNPTPVNIDTNKIVSGIQQAAENYNQQQAERQQVAANFASQYWPSLTPNLPEIRQSTANTNSKWNQYSANKIEETIGWNNYYLPNGQLTTQGQYNALNGTWHVAGIPQWPSTELIAWQSTWAYTPAQPQVEQVTTPTQQAPKTAVWGTKQPAVSTPQNEVSEQPASDIENWQTPESWKKQKEETPADNMNEQALANMEADLGWDNTWMLYGKVTANEWDPSQWIQTVADPYSVERATNQARIANLRKLQTMNSEDIATSITWWYTPYGEQAMRDLMQYNPEKYAEVQQYLKQQRGQESINDIMTWWNINATSQTKTNTDNVNNWITSRADSVTSNPEESSQVTKNIMNTMASNQVANSATQEMLNINKDLAEYQYKLDNVMNEAKASFKWDVPQYIVDAKANNLTQKYQAEIQKLESRYNSALDLYKTELNQAQRQAEMQLKYLQFQQDVTNDQWTKYYQSQQLLQNNIKRVDGVAYQVDPATWWYKQLTNTTAYDTYNIWVQTALNWYLSMYYDWYECWLQCEWFTDNFTQVTAWVRMEWADGRWFTYADEKLSYINDLTPSVWNVIVAVWWAYDSTYWHTMLITWYDPESWIIDLMWSNTNWDRTIHTSRTTMQDLQRNATSVWIWNPYLTAQNQSTNNYLTWGYTQYGVTVTPMTNIFDEMIAKGKDTDTIAKAEQAYTYLYEMVNDWSLQQLIESGDIWKIMAYMSKWKFWEKDDAWSWFADRLKQYIEKKAAKELTGWDESLKALNKLVQLVEVKLRKESWAAINSSERLTNFEMFLPQAWETTSYQRDKMASRDSLILRNLRSAWLSSVNNYIPIFWTQARQIRAY